MDQVEVILDTKDGEGARAKGLVIVPLGPTNGSIKRQIAEMKAAQRKVVPLHQRRRANQLVSALITPRNTEKEGA